MTSHAIDHYARLGVSPSATSEEIRKAFRNLARLHHPDVAADKARAEEMFKRLHEAYSVLMDRTQRRSYDNSLHAARVATLFRAKAKAAQAPAPTPAPAPRRKKKTEPERTDLDVESELEITMEDAIHGATYVLTLRQQDASRRRAPAKVDLHTCRVEIPPMVFEGQRLRLRGLGYSDSSTGSMGNLFLTVRYAKQTKFRHIGENLVTEFILTPWEAALGGRKRVETLDGMADLHVPPGTQPGQRLRVPGRGLPQPDGTRGDLHVAVRLRVPTAISEKERQLWQAIASQHR